MNQVTSHQCQEGTTNQYDQAQENAKKSHFVASENLSAVSTLDWAPEERELQELPIQGPRGLPPEPPEVHGGSLEISSVSKM